MIDVGLAIDLFVEDETGFLITSDRVGDALVEVVVHRRSSSSDLLRISPAEDRRLRSLIRRDGWPGRGSGRESNDRFHESTILSAISPTLGIDPVSDETVFDIIGVGFLAITREVLDLDAVCG
jgi:hypothetical protein